jgi:hypothetical protein
MAPCWAFITSEGQVMCMPLTVFIREGPTERARSYIHEITRYAVRRPIGWPEASL